MVSALCLHAEKDLFEAGVMRFAIFLRLTVISLRYACAPKRFYCRRALCDFEKGAIFLQEIYQLWSPTGKAPNF